MSMKLKKSGRAGFTLVEIMIVVAIIGLLAAIAIPNFVTARTTSQQDACLSNLRQIDGAKQTWGLENQLLPNATPNDSDIQPYLGRGVTGGLPYCPADSNQSFDTSYSANNLQIAPTCKINSATHIIQ
jgi:prepilin-type N-terminal cleavage/methylation domain-containing protein